MNRIKIFSFATIAAMLCGCVKFEEKKFSEVPFIDVTSADLFVGAGVPEGRGSIQLTSSPEGKQYTWTSLQPSVATVSQTGLVTAVSAGFSEITVASDNHATSVNIRVREWVPLESFTLGNLRRYVSWSERFQIFVNPVPSDASEVKVKWESSDPNIASVLENGWVTYWGEEGEFATITATIEGVGQQSTTFGSLVRLDRSGWTFPGYDDNTEDPTISYSTQATNEGASPNGRVIGMLDGNTATYWHSRYRSPSAVYPHWYIISLNQLVEVHALFVQQRAGNAPRGATGFYFYTCETEPTDPNDPVNGYDWRRVGEYPFRAIDDEQVVYIDDETEPLPKARYIKMYFDTQHRGTTDYAMMAEFGLFGRVLED